MRSFAMKTAPLWTGESARAAFANRTAPWAAYRAREVARLGCGHSRGRFLDGPQRGAAPLNDKRKIFVERYARHLNGDALRRRRCGDEGSGLRRRFDDRPRAGDQVIAHD